MFPINLQKYLLDCAQSMAVMSTNAVTFLLLNKYRKGVIIDELVNALDELREDLLSIRRDFGFTGDSLDVINYAVSILTKYIAFVYIFTILNLCRNGNCKPSNIIHLSRI